MNIGIFLTDVLKLCYVSGNLFFGQVYACIISTKHSGYGTSHAAASERVKHSIPRPTKPFIHKLTEKRVKLTHGFSLFGFCAPRTKRIGRGSIETLYVTTFCRVPIKVLPLVFSSLPIPRYGIQYRKRWPTEFSVKQTTRHSLWPYIK